MSRKYKLYHGNIYHNRKFSRVYDKLLDKLVRCQACGSHRNLEPHHIVKCNVYDDLFYDESNITVLCKNCHDYYHNHYYPYNKDTFDSFCNNKNRLYSKSEKKRLKKENNKNKRRKYKLKEHYLSPLYTKIKVADDNCFKSNDTKRNVNRSKKKKRKFKRKSVVNKRLNPIYLDYDLGSESYEYDYMDKKLLEYSVLGDVL